MQTFLVCLLSLCLYLCRYFYIVFFVSWSQSVRIRALARSLRLQIPACFPERLLRTAADSLVKVPQDLRQNKNRSLNRVKIGTRILCLLTYSLCRDLGLNVFLNYGLILCAKAGLVKSNAKNTCRQSVSTSSYFTETGSCRQQKSYRSPDRCRSGTPQHYSL